jgi:enamine deaminase RidA (YjgF/YER057c/UK114 family)
MIKHEIQDNNSIKVYVSYLGDNQLHLTVSTPDRDIDPIQACTDAYRAVSDILVETNMQIVHERIFGSSDVDAVMEARKAGLADSGLDSHLPVTYVMRHPVLHTRFAGLQLHAVRPEKPGDLWRIRDNESTWGSGWKRHGKTFLMLQNLHGFSWEAGADNSRGAQAKRMFELTERLLEANGSHYRDVAKTWIYLSEILDWYDEFNQVRNKIYSSFDLLPSLSSDRGSEPILLPASTGIKGESSFGAGCLMDVLAVLGETERDPSFRLMSNIKQKDAFLYGSAFSRGAYIPEPDLCQIYISGTAAIDEKGDSLFPDDARRQITFTLDAIDALLKQEGASLKDICDATVFLKRKTDIHIFREICEELGLADMPHVMVVADVCRDELLFEMDAFAARDRR